MSNTYMTADQRCAAFRKWGVPYKEFRDWRHHNRGAKGQVHGILVHHTGDDLPDSVDEKLLYEGRPDLSGPLCDWGMRDDGVAVMEGQGLCNHAGRGSSVTFQHVVREDYGIDAHLRPGADDMSGNPVYYGQETMYSGKRAMTVAAYTSTVLACAAVCDFHGWTGKSVIGHKEHTSRKSDPASLDLARLRQDVNAALAAGPGNWPEPHQVGPQEGVETVALTEQDVATITQTVTAVVRSEGVNGAGDPVVMLERGYRQALAEGLDRLATEIAALRAEVDRLTPPAS